jgi:hypothetical protein
MQTQAAQRPDHCWTEEITAPVTASPTTIRRNPDR